MSTTQYVEYKTFNELMEKKHSEDQDEIIKKLRRELDTARNNQYKGRDETYP